MTPNPNNVPDIQNGQPQPTHDFATVDHDRSERCGHGEVIYAAGKLPEEVVAIARELLKAQRQTGDSTNISVKNSGGGGGRPSVLATRCDTAQIEALRQAFASTRPVEVGARSGAVIVGTPEVRSTTPIPVVTAGTSDLKVAEEVAMTCRALGFTPRPINDVGVAGVHRVLNRVDELRRGNSVIVVAGMEGALPSVVGGLVDVPVIAVPTSVGYGASFGGLSALLGMLNSCASGVTVVNIDNGFGAAYAACQIERMVMRAHSKSEIGSAKSEV